MESLFTSDYLYLWVAVLAAALFIPVRQLIWVMSVRRQQRKTGEFPPEEVRRSLKSRASVTSGLLCLVFAATYGGVVFSGNL